MLSATEKEKLDNDGYVNLGQLLSDDQVNTVNNRLIEIQMQEGENAGSELFDSKYIRHPKEEGADRLADLVNKGAVFDIFYTHPKVLAAIGHVLGSSHKLSSLNYRAALPGKGSQNLHVDWKDGVPNGSYKVCNSIWLLDDFTPDNGATRIVPGTHKQSALPQDLVDDLSQPHPDEVVITGRAGSVFIFNSHVWHGGTTNRTEKPRRSIHSYFCTSDQAQQIDQSRYITSETRKRIGKSGCAVLDVDYLLT